MGDAKHHSATQTKQTQASPLLIGIIVGLLIVVVALLGYIYHLTHSGDRYWRHHRTMSMRPYAKIQTSLPAEQAPFAQIEPIERVNVKSCVSIHRKSQAALLS